MKFPTLPIEPLEVYVVAHARFDLYTKEEAMHFGNEDDVRRATSADLALLSDSRVRRDYMKRIRHRRRAYVALSDGDYLWNFPRKQYELAPATDVILDSLPQVDAIVDVVYLPELNLPPRWRVTADVGGLTVRQELWWKEASKTWAAGAVSDVESQTVIETWSTNHVIRHLQNQWLQAERVQHVVLASLNETDESHFA